MEKIIFNLKHPLLKAIFDSLFGVLFLLLFFVILWMIIKISGLAGLNIQIDSNILIQFITILSTILLALFIYHSNKNLKEKEEKDFQFDLLVVLSIELNYLEDNLKAYLKTFSEKPIFSGGKELFKFPVYELWDFNLPIYLEKISNLIEKNSTKKLKEDLIFIKDKVILINNFKLEMRILSEREDGFRVNAKTIREEIKRIINEEILQKIEELRKLLKEKFNVDAKNDK